MKKLITACILFSLLTSCKKDVAPPADPTEQVPGPATMKFDANGQSFEFNGTQVGDTSEGSIIKVITFAPTHYYFLNGSNGLSKTDSNYFEISIPLTQDNITTGTYHSSDLAAIGTLGNIHYGHLSNVPENYSITITSISNGYANGTFTAILAPMEDPSLPEQNILNGEFKNVKIQ